MKSQRGIRRGTTTGFAVVVLAAASSGCASFEERVVAVEGRTAALEAQVADLQTSQQNVVNRLVQIRQEIENSLGPLRTQSADRGEDFRALQREVSALEARIAQLDSRIVALTEQLAGGAGGGAATPSGTPLPPPRGARAAPRGGNTAPPDQGQENVATALYNNAYNDYLRENYGLCIAGFNEYIDRFGSSDRADHAQYWIGECYNAQGDAQSARQSFARLIQRYPDSEMVPDAMLQDGLILRSQGQDGAAAEVFRRLIRAYEISDAAGLACGQLEAMGADTPTACEELLD